VTAASDAVRISLRDGVCLIQLDDPSGYPRLTRAVLEELHRQLDELKNTPQAGATVITGTEKCFAAGADLTEVGALRAAEALRFSALGQSLMQKIEQNAKPVIAAIRGYCLGGGLDLALACRLRIAASHAVFGHPGAALGIITGWGGTQRLPRILRARGRARAMEMLTSGRTITAGEAYAWGLVSQVAEPEKLLEAAFAMARACVHLPT
jgi:enoyl-CoA hydratase/carnithine racemase